MWRRKHRGPPSRGHCAEHLVRDRDAHHAKHLYGAITWGMGGDQRKAILSTALLVVIRRVLLTRIDMARGREAAAQADRAPLG